MEFEENAIGEVSQIAKKARDSAITFCWIAAQSSVRRHNWTGYTFRLY